MQNHTPQNLQNNLQTLVYLEVSHRPIAVDISKLSINKRVKRVLNFPPLINYWCLIS